MTSHTIIPPEEPGLTPAQKYSQGLRNKAEEIRNAPASFWILNVSTKAIYTITE